MPNAPYRSPVIHEGTPVSSSPNQAQIEAIEHNARSSGPLIILAGPGTGKTHVIKHRVAHLIREQGHDPGAVLAVTFTVKAANELRERIVDILGPDVGNRVQMHTFNGFGNRILQRYATYLGMPPALTMLDEVQSRRLIKELILTENLFKSERAGDMRSLAADCERAMDSILNTGKMPEDCYEAAEMWRRQLDQPAPDMKPETLAAERVKLSKFEDQAKLYDLYTNERRRRGWISYTDQIALPLRLLRTCPGPAAMIRSEISAVIVDEFQDCNLGQIELLRHLMGPETHGGKPDITVVGDDDQAIYGFRGADIYAFRRFAHSWKDCNPKVVTLTENYRSQPEIIASANAIIQLAGERFAPDKTIVFPRDLTPVGGRVEAIILDQEFDDAEAIAADLLTARAHAERAGVPFSWRDHAVIARTTSDLGRISAILMMYDIPFDQVKQKSVLNEEGVENIASWVEWLLNPTLAWAANAVMAAAPYSAPMVGLVELHKAYDAQRARVRQGFVGAVSAGPYHTWVRTRLESDEECHLASKPMILAALEMYERLNELVQGKRGDDALFEIVRETAAGLADLLPSRERHKRIQSLLSMVSFAREKQGRLAKPGMLSELWLYFGEFDDWRSQSPSAAIDVGEDEELEPAADAESPLGRVQLLTAHASKGLQFECVYVPRVTSPHGYPIRKGTDDRWQPPATLIAAADDKQMQTAVQLRDDEERRLFYVACTRAKRRLVLLSKRLAAKSTTLSFFRELVGSSAAPAPQQAAEVLGRAFELGVGSPSWNPQAPEGPTPARSAPANPAKAASEQAHRVRTMLRLGAAAALERAQSSGFDPSQMADLEQALTEALHTFAALGAAQRTGELPKFEMSPRARVAAQEYLALRAAREKPAPAGIFPIVAPKGPLELSYTAIDSYLTCPRCYYLRNCMGVPQRESEFATTGITVHKALELFFNEWRLADAEGEALPGLVRLQELARATYEAGLAPSAAPDDALLDQLRHQMIVAFENLHSPNDHILELEQKILFDYPLGGMKHRFVAKIDRIDESPDGGKRVIDYKTGNATEKLKQPKKDDLQFGIYLLAMQNRFGADIRGRGEYWLLSTGEKGMLPFETMDLGKVREKIDEAITGILGGKFEPGKDCRNGDCKLIV